jgi:hypothetical protein
MPSTYTVNRYTLGMRLKISLLKVENLIFSGGENHGETYITRDLGV